MELLGTVILITGLFISKKGAIELGVDRWAGETDDENIQLPKVRDRLVQSRRAMLDGFFIIVGVGIQIFAVWFK